MGWRFYFYFIDEETEFLRGLVILFKLYGLCVIGVGFWIGLCFLRVFAFRFLFFKFGCFFGRVAFGGFVSIEYVVGDADAGGGFVDWVFYDG